MSDDKDEVDCAAPAAEDEAADEPAPDDPGKAVVPTTGDLALPTAFDDDGPGLLSVDGLFLCPALEVEGPLADDELPPGAAATAAVDDSPERCLAVARSAISYVRQQQACKSRAGEVQPRANWRAEQEAATWGPSAEVATTPRPHVVPTERGRTDLDLGLEFEHVLLVLPSSVCKYTVAVESCFERMAVGGTSQRADAHRGHLEGEGERALLLPRGSALDCSVHRIMIEQLTHHSRPAHSRAIRSRQARQLVPTTPSDGQHLLPHPSLQAAPILTLPDPLRWASPSPRSGAGSSAWTR
jgi:hypothetical protein